MEVMKGYADNYFALALVDCPYGIGEDGSKNHTRGLLAISKDYKPYSGNDLVPPSSEFFKELFRVSKNQIIWGANHFIERINKNSPCWIVWDKKTARPILLIQNLLGHHSGRRLEILSFVGKECFRKICRKNKSVSTQTKNLLIYIVGFLKTMPNQATRF